MMRLIGGARPTGGLHIGHLVGMLRPFLDNVSAADESFFVLADMHMLTTDAHSETRDRLDGDIRRLVAECVGAGISPRRTHFLRQSHLVEQGQMYAIVQSLVPWAPLIEHASYIGMAQYTAAPSLGLLGYAVLEAADAVVLQATHMAVGEHNVDHVRVAQHIVRTLNATWRTELVEPTPRTGGRNVIGLDGGTKMSKSLGNSVPLTASDSDLVGAARRMALWDDGGRCIPVEILTGLGLDDRDGDALAAEVRAGSMDTEQLRELVLDRLREVVEPIRTAATQVSADPDAIDDWLLRGADRARELARDTLAQVRSAIGLGAIPARQHPVHAR
jgi:tryptophanyl-tRNA synthetase